jgi:hypothetical protein
LSRPAIARTLPLGNLRPVVGRQLLRRLDDLPDPALLLALLTLRNQIVAALPT